MRSTPGRAATPLRWFAIAYVDLFRGLPAIVTIYLVGFGLPQALPDLFNHNPVNGFLFGSEQISLLQLGVISLTLVYGAYVAEVFRSGIESIHWSQTAAARSLGLSHGQTHAPRRRSPSGAPRRAAAAQRLHRAAEGHRARLGDRRARRASTRRRSTRATTSTCRSVVGLGICFVVITIPMTRFTDWLVERDQRRMRANG